jgi:hypothetical protein
MALTPAPGNFGLNSLQLGNWFDGAAVTLGMPDPTTLSVGAPAARAWLPPATGTLTLLRSIVSPAGGSPHIHGYLAEYQQVDGTPVWTASGPDELVAVFTLLPLVHLRLSQVYAASGTLLSIAGEPSRPVPNRWVLRLPMPASDTEMLDLFPFKDALELELGDLGFGFDTELHSLPRPMTFIRRTGASSKESLLTIPAGSTLTCFDVHGLPVDAGAVAAAFTQLTTEFANLSSGFNVQAVDARSVHLTGPVGRPLSAETLSLVSVNGTAPAPQLVTHSDDNVTVAAADSTTTPFLRFALQPTGAYTNSLPVNTSLLTRDFIRVSALDYEQELTGVAPTDPEQARVSTKINIAPSTATDTFLDSADSVLNVALAQTAAAGRGPLVATLGQIDGGIGPFATPPSLPDEPPVAFDAISIEPLYGGEGTDESGWSPDMQAVLELLFPAELNNAWVQVIPLGFNTTTGVRTRLVGGAGRVVAHDGGSRALTVVSLPPGPNDGSSTVTFDVVVVTAVGRLVVSSVSLERPVRPTSVPGGLTAPVVLAATGASPVGDLYTCETGSDALVSGMTSIVEVSGDHLAVDTSRVPGSAFSQSVASNLRSGDRITLSSPPWEAEPKGNGLVSLCASVSSGLVIKQHRRGGVSQLLQANGTLPGHYRHDVVLSEARDGVANALLTGGGLLQHNHQAVQFSRERSAEPAAAEGRLEGVALAGPAAGLLHKLSLDHAVASSIDYLSQSVSAPSEPVNPAAPARWVAALQTNTPRVVGERELNIANEVDAYPFDRDTSSTDTAHQQKRTWLERALVLRDGDLPATPDTLSQDRFDRAADRRMKGALKGYSEFIAPLRQAISNAQRFIYIETPSLTAGQGLSASDDTLDILGLLGTQLASKANLYVLICVPQRDEHVFPPLRHLRTQLQIEMARSFASTTDAVLQQSGSTTPAAVNDRVVVFSPLGSSGRPVHPVSTTVIVDDVLCLTGSTEISRRGLTFDSSTALSVIDDTIVDGISPAIRTFRNQLIGQLLGEDPQTLPHDGRVLTNLIRQTLAQGSSHRITQPEPPEASPGDVSMLQPALDPDGRLNATFDIGTFLTSFVSALTSGGLTNDDSEPDTCV